MLVICDIDGTLFNNEHRAEFIPDDVTVTCNWRKFNSMSPYDAPIRYRIQMLSLVAMQPGVEIVYLTGRSDEFRDETAAKLNLERCPPGKLHMRYLGDHRPAAQVKVDALLDIAGARHFAFIDDDMSICHAVARTFPAANIIKVPSQDCAYLAHSRNLELCQ